MDQMLSSQVERSAQGCETLRAFSGLNLLHVKRQVSILLDLIGRDGIFDEYTVHNISHIDAMLELADTMIPASTRAILTAADHLMLCLSIYFHDLGMLVTRREYEQREISGFPKYRDEVLFGGTRGVDYRTKVAALKPERAERFLYQEFVRHTHAERIRNWIVGRAPVALGITHPVMIEIDQLLQPLPAPFRRDLALVAESHHLDDLDNLSKYVTSCPYGTTPAETANVQYAALMLRTVDLLHMTSDRVPSVAFKVIDPSDPISQVEWAKQRSVTCVRPMTPRNRDGQRDESRSADTIEVFAYFRQPEGFFALTKFLKYCSEQLRLSNQWSVLANTQEKAPHVFPWRQINEDHVQAEGFIPTQFEFSLDQEKILNLLTGHTLYNDTDVVLRELVQNAIDAVRLQKHQEPAHQGVVVVRWNSRTRELSVEDNGTGMTQEIIVRHLLKAGSSRYQDPQFIKMFPGFSSISRFGIGVLSAFMIADSVDVFTCHPDELTGRHLALRSVHGKYLIRLIEKTDANLASLNPHGTRVVLAVRTSAALRDVVETLKKWIVVPVCNVKVYVDDGDGETIGFSSTQQALEAFLHEEGYDVWDGNSSPDLGVSVPARISTKVRVVNHADENLSLSFAVVWSSFFREWGFLQTHGTRRQRMSTPNLGTCVEGIRVEFGSPGFTGPLIVALADARGRGAPRTNVARSGLEATPERNQMLAQVYSILIAHVTAELGELVRKRGCSLTKAVKEANILLSPLLMDRRGGNPNQTPISSGHFEEALRQANLILVESDGERRLISGTELKNVTHIWTVDSEFHRSAERLLGELPVQSSIGRLVGSVGPGQQDARHRDLLLCGYRGVSAFDRLATEGREIDEIHLDKAQHRIDLRWSRKCVPPRWLICEITDDRDDMLLRSAGRIVHDTLRVGRIFVTRGDVALFGQKGDEIGVRAFNSLLIYPGTGMAKVMMEYYEHMTSASLSSRAIQLILNSFGAIVHISLLRHSMSKAEDVSAVLQQKTAALQEVLTAARLTINAQAVLRCLLESSGEIYNPAAFTRENH